MFSDIISIYGAVVSTISLIAVFILYRKRFKAKWEPLIPIIPIIRAYLICPVEIDTYTIRVTLHSKRGDVIIYKIEQLTRKGFFQQDGSKMTVRYDLKKEEFKKDCNYLFKVEEGIPMPLKITFTLPKDKKRPLKDKTGIEIFSSAKHIKKPFNINWS